MNTITSNVNVLNELLAVNLNINLWSARKKLNSEDIGDIALPPEELATLGSKRVAPPESIRIFNTLKSRAVNFLDKHGVRFMSGWVVPKDTATTVIAEFEEIQEVFNKHKEEFLLEYDQIIDAWITKNGEWANIIKSSVVDRDYVRERFNFNWQIYKVALSRQKYVNAGLVQEVEGLGNTLYAEIAKTATEIWDKVYKDRTEVTRKALSPLKNLQQKLMGLSFIEPHVSHVAHLIQLVLDNLPVKGNISGSDLLMLHGLVTILSNTSNLLEQAELIMQGENLSTVLDAVIAIKPELELEEMPEFSPPTISSLGLW